MEEIWTHANATAKDTLPFMWSLGELKISLGVMETLSGSPPFYIKRYILRCIMLLRQHHNMIQIPKESFLTLKSYTHSQFHLVKDFQQSNMHCFDQALITLATEDTAMCYEAVQHYQALVNKDPYDTIQPTLNQLEDFVMKIVDEQHTTLTRQRFGTINSNNVLLTSKDKMTKHMSGKENIGTFFL